MSANISWSNLDECLGDVTKDAAKARKGSYLSFFLRIVSKVKTFRSLAVVCVFVHCASSSFLGEVKVSWLGGTQRNTTCPVSPQAHGKTNCITRYPHRNSSLPRLAPFRADSPWSHCWITERKWDGMSQQQLAAWMMPDRAGWIHPSKWIIISSIISQLLLLLCKLNGQPPPQESFLDIITHTQRELTPPLGSLRWEEAEEELAEPPSLVRWPLLPTYFRPSG